MKILLQAIKSLMRKTENSIKRVLNFFDEGGIIKQEHLPDGYPYEAPAKILPNTTLEIDLFDGGAGISTPFSLVVGCKYTVTWNGTDYVCEAKEASIGSATGIGVGNVDMLTGGNDTGEPFIIIAANNDYTQESGYYGIVQIWNEPSVVTFSISGMAATKMDVKYLPDGYPYMETVEVLPKTAVEFDPEFLEGNIATPFTLVPGNEYTVTWNGAEYICKAQGLEEGIAIGYSIDMGEEPFLILNHTEPINGFYAGVMSMDGSTFATISIVEGEITKMDARYLPDEVALKSDLENISGNSSSDMAWLPAVSEEGIISWSRSSTTTAPESQNIKGPTGERGTGLLPITTAPSSYTTTVNELTPAYRITLDTVKTEAGVTEVFAGDTLQYSYYHYPVIYVDSSYVYCGTQVNIRGAAGAAGTGIQSITPQGQDANGGNVYTVLLTDETSYTITAPKGDAGGDGSPATATTLPESGTALTANTIYNVADVVGTYAFTAPESGWAHGEFTTDSNASVSFAGRFLGAVPNVEASKTYEFDVLNGSWVVQEVITV